MAFDIKKFLARFVEEARDQVTSLNEGILRLERYPEDTETINTIFRSAHTIKGSSRMMKLAPIAEVAHKTEDVLGALRDKKIRYSRELGDLLLRGIDIISEMIEKVAAGQKLPEEKNPLCDILANAAEGNLTALAPEKTETSPFPAPDPALMNGPEKKAVAGPVLASPEVKQSVPPEPKAKISSDTFRIRTEKLDELIKLMGEIVTNQNRTKQRLVETKEIEHISKKLKESLSGSGDETATGQVLLSGLKQLVSAMKDDITTQELMMTELQEKALLLRMVPLATIFDPLHRMVRDISRTIGKEVELIVEGSEIEIDRKMIDKLSDPLIHMIRNSLDHGIETPEERLKAGKPETSLLKISASYDAGNVLIEVSDDGNGISIEKIKNRALKKKMFDEDTLNSMSSSGLIDLIFQPGFSTSALITDVSGRGVGMDVVKRNIVEDLKGTVSTETRDGQGTTFCLRLPLTLAIMRVMLVVVSQIPFAINCQYVSEILKINLDEIITVVDKKAIRLREEFIQVVRLGTLFNLSGNRADNKDLLIVIVNTGTEKLGLIVDELRDEESVVIKPLPSHMKSLKMISGVTISGKNEIINVLHVPTLFSTSKEIKEMRPAKTATEEGRKSITILVVDDSVNTRDIEKGILETYGYKVDIAIDGMEALEKAREFTYDLVITDVEMPRLDGFSLTEKLRSTESYKETPIIIVTSREKEEDRKRGIAVGANAYIVKGSFDQSNLLETVQNLAG